MSSFMISREANKVWCNLYVVSKDGKQVQLGGLPLDKTVFAQWSEEQLAQLFASGSVKVRRTEAGAGKASASLDDFV